MVAPNSIEELKKLNLDSLIDTLVAISSENLHKGNHSEEDCLSCQMRKKFDNSPLLRGITITGALEILATDNPEEVIAKVFVIGFHLAWVYRNNKELENQFK